MVKELQSLSSSITLVAQVLECMHVSHYTYSCHSFINCDMKCMAKHHQFINQIYVMVWQRNVSHYISVFEKLGSGGATVMLSHYHCINLKT